MVFSAAGHIAHIAMTSEQRRHWVLLPINLPQPSQRPQRSLRHSRRISRLIFRNIKANEGRAQLT